MNTVLRETNVAPTQQQIIAYKLRLVSQLADSLQLFSADQDEKKRERKLRKGLRLISDTVFEAANEIYNLEPEPSVLDEVLAKLEARNTAHPLSRS